MRKTNFSTHFFSPVSESDSGRHATANEDGAHTGQQARYGRKQQQTKRYRRAAGGNGNPNRHCRHRADKTG